MEEQKNQTQTQKSKKVSVQLVLTGAASVNLEGINIKKGMEIEIDSSKADRFLQTGLFTKK